jgi:hypothetical protein
MTTDTVAMFADAAADADAALARLQDIIGRIGDGDLHRAHRDGGWSVAQVISHINVCAILWLGDLERLRNDAELRLAGLPAGAAGGATECLNVTETDVVPAVAGLTGGAGRTS